MTAERNCQSKLTRVFSALDSIAQAMQLLLADSQETDTKAKYEWKQKSVSTHGNLIIELTNQDILTRMGALPVIAKGHKRNSTNPEAKRFVFAVASIAANRGYINFEGQWLASAYTKAQRFQTDHTVTTVNLFDHLHSNQHWLQHLQEAVVMLRSKAVGGNGMKTAGVTDDDLSNQMQFDTLLLRSIVFTHLRDYLIEQAGIHPMAAVIANTRMCFQQHLPTPNGQDAYAVLGDEIMRLGSLSYSSATSTLTTVSRRTGLQLTKQQRSRDHISNTVVTFDIGPIHFEVITANGSNLANNDRHYTQLLQSLLQLSGGTTYLIMIGTPAVPLTVEKLGPATGSGLVFNKLPNKQTMGRVCTDKTHRRFRDLEELAKLLAMHSGPHDPNHPELRVIHAIAEIRSHNDDISTDLITCTVAALMDISIQEVLAGITQSAPVSAAQRQQYLADIGRTGNPILTERQPDQTSQRVTSLKDYTTQRITITNVQSLLLPEDQEWEKARLWITNPDNVNPLIWSLPLYTRPGELPSLADASVEFLDANPEFKIDFLQTIITGIVFTHAYTANKTKQLPRVTSTISPGFEQINGVIMHTLDYYADKRPADSTTIRAAARMLLELMPRCTLTFLQTMPDKYNGSVFDAYCSLIAFTTTESTALEYSNAASSHVQQMLEATLTITQDGTLSPRIRNIHQDKTKQYLVGILNYIQTHSPTHVKVDQPLPAPLDPSASPVLNAIGLPGDPQHFYRVEHDGMKELSLRLGINEADLLQLIVKWKRTLLKVAKARVSVAPTEKVFQTSSNFHISAAADFNKKHRQSLPDNQDQRTELVEWSFNQAVKLITQTNRFSVIIIGNLITNVLPSLPNINLPDTYDTAIYSSMLRSLGLPSDPDPTKVNMLTYHLQQACAEVAPVIIKYPDTVNSMIHDGGRLNHNIDDIVKELNRTELGLHKTVQRYINNTADYLNKFKREHKEHSQPPKGKATAGRPEPAGPAATITRDEAFTDAELDHALSDIGVGDADADVIKNYIHTEVIPQMETFKLWIKGGHSSAPDFQAIWISTLIERNRDIVWNSTITLKLFEYMRDKALPGNSQASGSDAHQSDQHSPDEIVVPLTPENTNPVTPLAQPASTFTPFTGQQPVLHSSLLGSWREVTPDTLLSVLNAWNPITMGPLVQELQLHRPSDTTMPYHGIMSPRWLIKMVSQPMTHDTRMLYSISRPQHIRGRHNMEHVENYNSIPVAPPPCVLQVGDTFHIPGNQLLVCSITMTVRNTSANATDRTIEDIDALADAINAHQEQPPRTTTSADLSMHGCYGLVSAVESDQDRYRIKALLDNGTQIFTFTNNIDKFRYTGLHPSRYSVRDSRHGTPGKTIWIFQSPTGQLDLTPTDQLYSRARRWSLHVAEISEEQPEPTEEAADICIVSMARSIAMTATALSAHVIEATDQQTAASSQTTAAIIQMLAITTRALHEYAAYHTDDRDYKRPRISSPAPESPKPGKRGRQSPTQSQSQKKAKTRPVPSSASSSSSSSSSEQPSHSDSSTE